MAAYRPGGKGLIFEGGGDTDFDKTLVNALFPEELRGVNLISGSNKARVKILHEVLERAYSKGDLPTKFFAITDKDSDGISENTKNVGTFQWDVYHIENYLIHENFIADVLNSLGMTSIYTAESVKNCLEDAARAVVPSVIIHRMRSLVNSHLVASINLGFPPETPKIAEELHKAASRSASRVMKVIGNELSEESLVQAEQKFRSEIELSFADGTWRRNLPGRAILKKFVSLVNTPVGYEVIRNLIVSKMVQASYKPQGMKEVIDQIVSA